MIVVKTSSPSSTRRQHRAGVGIDRLHEEMVLEDVHAVAALHAFHGDPGSHDLGEAVDVQRLDRQGVFDLDPHLLAPGFGAEDPDPEFQGLHVDPHCPPLLGQVQGVGGGAADRRRAEVLEDHDLPFRVAAGDGNDACPQLFGPVVGPEPAGEQAVAVSIVDAYRSS